MIDEGIDYEDLQMALLDLDGNLSGHDLFMATLFIQHGSLI